MNVCLRSSSAAFLSRVMPAASWTRSLLALSFLSVSLSCIRASTTDAGSPVSPAPSVDVAGEDLTELSLEELHAVSISAASKRSEPLFETPAAVSVLFPVDMQRAGANSVAEALRLVPGVHVINQLPSEWKIGIRGGNGLQSTKLLVLVDGRSVYSPFYGSVEWPNADVALDDIARVEVVRGPGATLWGANAVNGIINVISKDARDTQGGVVSARTGSGEPASGHLRYGAKLGDNTWFRVSASGASTDGSTGSLADSAIDNYSEARVSWRSDSVLGDRFRLTTQAEVLENRRKILAEASTHRVNSLLTRLSGSDVFGGDGQIQLYYDSTRDRVGATDKTSSAPLPYALNGNTSDVDLDINFHLRIGRRHDVILGGGARFTDDVVEQSQSLRLTHPESKTWLFNYFIQDEISLTPKQWRLTLGSKLEHHETIGYEALPNVRLAWLPNSQNTLWTAVSRAARAPSRSERESLANFANIPATQTSPAVRVQLAGSPNFGAETSYTYEAGWRWRPTPRFSTDATVYSFDYEHVRDLGMTTAFEAGPPPTVVQTYNVKNGGSARMAGAELSWTWRPSDRWELNGGVGRSVAQNSEVQSPLIAPDFYVPRWLGHVSSWWQLPRDFEFSTTVYAVGENAGANVAGYVRLDAQLLWRPRADIELSLGVQNATDPSHSETITGNFSPSDEVRRNVYGRVQWRF